MTNYTLDWVEDLPEVAKEELKSFSDEVLKLGKEASRLKYYCDKFTDSRYCWSEVRSEYLREFHPLENPLIVGKVISWQEEPYNWSK